MKKFTISLCILGFALTAKAQVGVNTTYPRGVFNVDATKNNTNTTTPATIVTESADDVVVDATGKVGIGTNAPAVKLDIETGGTATTPVPGFKLADGTQNTGKVLTSDANGVGTWNNLPSSWVGVLRGNPFVSSTGGGDTDITWSTGLINGTGGSYDTNGITVPTTGIYQITVAGHFGGNHSPYLINVKIFKGSDAIWSPHIGCPYVNWGTTTNFTGVFSLNAGDTISVKLSTYYDSTTLLQMNATLGAGFLSVVRLN